MPQKAEELQKLLDNWRRHVGAKMPVPNPDWSLLMTVRHLHVRYLDLNQLWEKLIEQGIFFCLIVLFILVKTCGYILCYIPLGC